MNPSDIVYNIGIQNDLYFAACAVLILNAYRKLELNLKTLTNTPSVMPNNADPAIISVNDDLNKTSDNAISVDKKTNTGRKANTEAELTCINSNHIKLNGPVSILINGEIYITYNTVEDIIKELGDAARTKYLRSVRVKKFTERSKPEG